MDPILTSPATRFRPIQTAADAEAIRAEIETFTDEGWDREGTRFDWDNWLDRIERDLNLDLGSDLFSPGIKTMQQIARRAAREGAL
jgi:hypothetical protein